MELKQSITIPVSQQQVWDNLNDPAVLKACLPGCEEFSSRQDESNGNPGQQDYDIVMLAKVGPVKARFKGELALSDVEPPTSYRIAGSGKGGVAGFAKGGAMVHLAPADDGNATLMTYTVEASVGGKLAQLGSRLVMGAARKMANDFFVNFVRHVSGDDNLAPLIETAEPTKDDEN